jgi:hypothetical protein
VPQEVEHLPSTLKALNSNPSTKTKKQRKERRKEGPKILGKKLSTQNSISRTKIL